MCINYYWLNDARPTIIKTIEYKYWALPVEVNEDSWAGPRAESVEMWPTAEDTLPQLGQLQHRQLWLPEKAFQPDSGKV